MEINPLLSEQTIERNKPRAVIVWAIIGACFILLACYIWGQWLIDGPQRIVDTGVTPVPQWMVISGWAQIIILDGIVLWMIYNYVIKTYIRTKSLNFDSLFVLAFMWVYWQDPVPNYITTFFGYSSTVPLSWTGWAEFIPGWLSPNGNAMPEPIFWDIGAYLGGFGAGVFMANHFMAKARARWPRLSNFGLIVWTYIVLVIVELIMESIWVRLGIHFYGGAHPQVSLYAGHFYQFPIYEAILVGGIWTGWACIRFFKNEKGQTLIEYGVDRIKSKKMRYVLTYLALAGWINLCYFLSYSVPAQFINIHQAAWPEDTYSRSYLTNGLVGPGTDYAIPGPTVPIFKDTASLSINSDGELIIPPGVEKPTMPDQTKALP